MRRLRPRIDVADLGGGPDDRAIAQEAADHARDPGHHRPARHRAEEVTGLDPVADSAVRHAEPTRGGGAQDALDSATSDISRHAGVRLRSPFEDDGAEGVTAVGLDHRVHVAAGGEPRPETDDDRRLAPERAQVPFRHPRVDDGAGAQAGNHPPLGIHEDRDLLFHRDPQSLVGPVGEPCPDPLDLRRSIAHRLGEGNGAAHRGGRFELGHDDPKTAPVKADGATGGEVPRPLDYHESAVGHRASSRQARLAADRLIPDSTLAGEIGRLFTRTPTAS